MDTSALLPIWIIGAPLVLAVINRVATPAAGRLDDRHPGTPIVRTPASATGAARLP